jgi:transposase
MPLTATLPAESGVRVDSLAVVEGMVVAVVAATRATVPCPVCGKSASRVHSHYRRTVADLPWQGVPVRLDLHTRRFYCDAPTCPRQIFAERFPDLVAAGARRSARLSTLYLAISLVLGGEAGTRLAADLGLTVSPDTLLRITTADPLPASPTPRVLGVDDWSWRRGRRWGTILVDLERHRPIEILPDRQADTLARWLQDHPGVQYVARDRAGAYADGIRTGAPDAVQIADRLHLVKNAGEALEQVLRRHHASLRAAAKAVDQAAGADDAPPCAPEAGSAAAPASPAPPAPPVAAPPAGAEQAQTASRDRRAAQYAEVLALSRQGLGPTAVAQRVGLTRQTVARWLRAGVFPERAPAAPRHRGVAAHEPYLRERWQAGCQHARQLWRELRERGFTGGAEAVRRLVVAWRASPARPGPPRRRPATAARAAPPPPATRPRSPRQARWLLVKPEEALTPDQQAYVTHLVQACPEVLVAQRLTRECNRLVRERDQGALAPWLTAAQTSVVPEFGELAKGFGRDHAAVEAALQYEWSSGQVEAQVLQVKALRRQMRGRGGFALVRRRVVKAA